MSSTLIFIVGAAVFALTVFGAVMASGIALTRRFYEENESYTDRPGFEHAGVGASSGNHHRPG
jgi:hypothetical protein